MILGAVLAGGRSRRFGSDKAVAMLDGQPLIDHAAGQLAPHVAEVVVCGREPGLADRPAPDLGPLGGLCAALFHADSNGFDRVLTIACDVPRLPDGILPLLLAEGSAILADLPVVGIWPAALGPDLEAHLAGDGDRSIRGWARACGARLIAAPPIANINTPQDLAAFTGATPDAT